MEADPAPWHVHVYYDAEVRARAAALRDALRRIRDSGAEPRLAFVGELRDHPVGPHLAPQFEAHFTAGLVPVIRELVLASGLVALIHPLTLDDLADHTRLGQWLGAPLALDLTVLDPPGVNQGLARFGISDF